MQLATKPATRWTTPPATKPGLPLRLNLLLLGLSGWLGGCEGPETVTGSTMGMSSDPTDASSSDDPVTTLGPATTEVDPSGNTTTADSPDSRGDSGSTSGEDTDSTPRPVACKGGADDLTDAAEVSASSQFDETFPPSLAVDSNRQTSWFSAGPGRDAGTSTFTWTAFETRCLSTLVFAGNDMHENEAFRVGFGFGGVTIRVLDVDDQVVFEEIHALAGTPDPQLDIDFGGIEGQRIELELTGHEDPSCGGFSEFAVLGR